ncbi:hypothetical protein HK096_003024 [Nowakowskiella sp. JEL0078]|nr:hypothetical protein HK096_003024 [Nowakowskiella sp. JEL0078]
MKRSIIFFLLLAAIASVLAKKCPLAESGCPYYSKNVEAHSGENSGCPATDCPYYKKHREAEGVVDLLFEEGHKCPLDEKCSFFKALKEGKLDEIDFKTSNCPLKEKCPYYQKIKSDPNAAKACPILSKCPKAADVHKRYIEKGADHPDYEAEAAKCPHLQKQKDIKAHKVDDEL